MRGPHTAMKSSPCLLQLEKAHVQQGRLNAAKNKINKFIKKTKKIRNQDGGVEGRALTPSCENTRITISCWTIINRKTLELTKKDTPHPKTKEKPQ